MEIICNKIEFSEIVRRCYHSEFCDYCALYGVCDGQDYVVALANGETATVRITPNAESRPSFLSYM